MGYRDLMREARRKENAYYKKHPEQDTPTNRFVANVLGLIFSCWPVWVAIYLFFFDDDPVYHIGLFFFWVGVVLLFLWFAHFIFSGLFFGIFGKDK